jgi:phosphonoacetaldehyde hydrolase
MEFNIHHKYKGKVKFAILDWAGTTVDFGSFAPTAVFFELFASRGVNITAEQARTPMGLMKKDHLRAIAFNPEVAKKWIEVYGSPVTDKDIDFMFDEFVPMQTKCLKEYATVIPGVQQAIKEFRRMGMKIGSTTGYTRDMMDVLVPTAKENGYSPDSWVSATDVPTGRPAPWMIYQNAINMQVFPMESGVKIGDTLVDIQEGINAGMWTIGLTVTGNMFGLTEDQVKNLSPEELSERRKAAADKMYEAGAHYVVDSMADCPVIMEEINYRLKRGESPRE